MDQRIRDHDFEGGYLPDSNGIDVITGANLSERDYFKEGMKGNTYISTPAYSEVTQNVSYVVAAPLWDGGIPGTKAVGVVVYIPNGEYLNDIMRSIKVGEGGRERLCRGCDSDRHAFGAEHGGGQEREGSDTECDCRSGGRNDAGEFYSGIAVACGRQRECGERDNFRDCKCFRGERGGFPGTVDAGGHAQRTGRQIQVSCLICVYTNDGLRIAVSGKCHFGLAFQTAE